MYLWGFLEGLPGAGSSQSFHPLHSLSFLLRVSIAVERYHGPSNSSKGKHITGAGLQFRALVHCHHEKEHGGVLADVVLEKVLRVPHLDLQTAVGESEPLGLP